MKSKVKFLEYKTYLFDADGTLFDTTSLVVKCFFHTFELYEHRLIRKDKLCADYIKSHMGIPLRTQMEIYFGALGDDEYIEIENNYSSYQQQIYKEHLVLFPKVKETLAKLKASGKKLAVVTSRKLESSRRYLKATKIDEYFDVLITPEATTKHKPNPEPVLEALKQLDSTSHQAVFIGDSVYDILAGNAANIDTIFVKWSHTDLSCTEVKPSYYIESMKQLLFN